MYAKKFEPDFHGDKIHSPAYTKLPPEAVDETDPVLRCGWKNVFVCSMADLFGQWVPQEWIDAVFKTCRANEQWNYLFLTKFPQRYVGQKFPPTAWVGTSVDTQIRVANAEKAFAKIKAPVKWLSCEPMLEPLKFNDIGVFDWVVIGGQSGGSTRIEKHPDPWWVIDLAYAAREAGCKVYLKENTFAGQRLEVKEYPAAMLVDRK